MFTFCLNSVLVKLHFKNVENIKICYLKVKLMIYSQAFIIQLLQTFTFSQKVNILNWNLLLQFNYSFQCRKYAFSDGFWKNFERHKFIWISNKYFVLKFRLKTWTKGSSKAENCNLILQGVWQKVWHNVIGKDTLKYENVHICNLKLF